jgi:hypothetical protein
VEASNCLRASPSATWRSYMLSKALRSALGATESATYRDVVFFNEMNSLPRRDGTSLNLCRRV